MPASAHRPFVIVTHALPEGWLALLESRSELLAGPADAAGLAPELLARLGEAEGLFTLLTVRVDEALLQRAPRLRVVSNMAVGVDNIDLAACTRRGIPVGHTPGVLTEATADLALALLLAAARRLPESSRDAREGRWTTWSPTGWLGADLPGATLGIVGMGKIGQAVATRARGFGLRILYADRNARPEVETNLDAQRVDLVDLLRQSDFVSLHVPLMAETRHLINESALRAMRRTAILINIGRGAIVPLADLVAALEAREIAGAALDVFETEPLPPDHPLWRREDVILTPHVAAASVHIAERHLATLLDNVGRFVRGEALLNVVDKARWC